jgi:type II secretory pathway component PulJ
MTRRCRTSRFGFSMIEIAVSIAMMSLLLGMLAVVLWATVRMEQAEAASFQRAMSLSQIADQFRLDVGRAHAAPGEFDEFKKTPQCLILKFPERTTIVYRWDRGRLERIEKGNDQVSRWFFTIPKDTESVNFRTVEGNKAVLELVLQPETSQLERRGRRATVVQAALEGERR